MLVQLKNGNWLKSDSIVCIKAIVDEPASPRVVVQYANDQYEIIRFAVGEVFEAESYRDELAELAKVVQ